MTAEEYKAKQKDISDQINELKKQSLELEHKYLSQEIRFDMGQKVKITETQTRRGEAYTEEHIAFIRSFHTHDSGETFYTFYKAKKDGTPSVHRLRFWGMDNKLKIEAL